MMFKFLIASVASLVLLTNSAQGASTSCISGAACQAATTFTIINKEKHCCQNSAHSVSGTSFLVDDILTKTCVCSDEAPAGDEAECLVGQATCSSKMPAGEFATATVNGATYCCDFGSDTISTAVDNGQVTCKCYRISASHPKQQLEAPETGIACCEGAAGCGDSTTTFSTDGKTFCCPNGGSALVQTLRGKQYCTCFEQQPSTCQFTNVLDKTVPGAATSGACMQRTAAAAISAVAVAAAAGVQV